MGKGRIDPQDVLTTYAVGVIGGAAVGYLGYETLRAVGYYPDLWRTIAMVDAAVIGSTSLAVFGDGLRNIMRIKKAGTGQSVAATFTTVAPMTSPNTIYHRGSWLADKLANRRVRKRLQAEQRQAEDRDTFAPARTHTLVFAVGGVQITGEIVYRFLSYAERNRERGRGLSKRYWTERCRSQWWNPVYYEPTMTLLAIAQQKSKLQLVIQPGHQWLALAHSARYTTGVIREHCPARWVRM